jgi:hypothetical protein
MTAFHTAGAAGILEAEFREIELAFANAMHQLDTRNRGRGAPEAFEAEHRVRSRFDVAMVLLDQVVQLLRGPDIRAFRQKTIGRHLTHRAVRGSIAIERDGLRRLPLMPDGRAEKGFGRGHFAPRPEHEVPRLASPIHRPVQVDPLAANLQVGLVDTPRVTRRCSKAVPAFDELGCITPHSAQDRRVSQRQSPFSHHLDQIA